MVSDAWEGVFKDGEILNDDLSPSATVSKQVFGSNYFFSWAGGDLGYNMTHFITPTSEATQWLSVNVSDSDNCFAVCGEGKEISEADYTQANIEIENDIQTLLNSITIN
jgi:hypothetical protein